MLPLIVAICAFFYASNGFGALLNLVITRADIPDHLLNHPVSFTENLVPESIGVELFDHMKNISRFQSNVAQPKADTTTVMVNEEIGEGQPITDEGACEHPFLTPNLAKTRCVLPQRFDVGMSFIKTGGVDGLRESYEKLVTRTTSFGQYNFFASSEMPHPAVAALFNSETFQTKSHEICPPDKQVLDPFQYNFIINVPGQTVPLHLDASTFDGATRVHYPQWLLIAMTFSGLFREKYIDTVQVVAYLHTWQPENIHKGDFVFFDENSARFKSVPPKPFAGTAVDGAKTIHAARTYMPHRQPPMLDKDKFSELVYVSDKDEWHLEMDGDFMRSYDTDELRVAIVYRARCFHSEASRQAFSDYMKTDPIPKLSLDHILGKFEQDLIGKGKLVKGEANGLSRLDLAMLIVNTYVKYPFPHEEIKQVPYNLCALPRLFPITNYLLQYTECGN